MRPVFCGNLDNDTRHSDLDRLFSKYGRVDRIDMKSGTTKEAELFSRLSKLHSKTIHVKGNLSLRTQNINSINMQLTFFIYIKQTHDKTCIAQSSCPSLIVEDLYHLAMPSDLIIIPCLQNGGYAFVYFDDERDAEDAMHRLDGIPFGYSRRRLSVEWSRQGERGGRERDGSRPAANTKPTRTLFVINFDPIRTRVRDLERHFEPYGTITNVRIRRNFAFIQFKTQEEATKALDNTNMSKILDRMVTVEYAFRDDDDGDHDLRDSPRRGGGGGYGRHEDRSYGRSDSSPVYRKGRSSPDYSRARSPPYDRYDGPSYGRSRSPEYGRSRR